MRFADGCHGFVVGVMLMMIAVSCTPAIHTTACPPVPTWTAEERAATADELDRAVAAGALDPEGPTVEALKDYELTRERLAKCQ